VLENIFSRKSVATIATALKGLKQRKVQLIKLKISLTHAHTYRVEKVTFYKVSHKRIKIDFFSNFTT
jgi:hypothetical protein